VDQRTKQGQKETAYGMQKETVGERLSDKICEL
jgi:hypothetical protein